MILTCYNKVNFKQKFNKQKMVTKHTPRSLIKTQSNMKNVVVKLATDDTWKLMAHTIVDFSAIYFTMNWLYYRSFRKNKNKKDKNN